MIVGYSRTFVVPPSFIEYRGDSSNTSTYTFSSLNFKTGRAVVLVHIQGTGSTTGISSVTLKGVSAAQDYNFAPQVQNHYDAWSADVTAGSGDIVVNIAGGNAARCGVGLWDVGSKAFNQGTTEQSTANPADLSVNTNAADVALAVVYDFNSTSYSATNLTERFDGILEGTNYHAFYDNLNCSGGSPESFTITASDSAPEAMLVIYR